MEDRISVRLIGPAKIDGKWRQPGEDVPVTPELVRELAAAGAIADSDAGAVADLAPGMPGFDQAVAAMAKTLADAAVQAALEAATAELIADRDAARSRADDAEAEVHRQTAQIMRLEAELAEALKLAFPLQEAAAETTAEDTPPQATAKNARKKGAGANQG